MGSYSMSQAKNVFNILQSSGKVDEFCALFGDEKIVDIDDNVKFIFVTALNKIVGDIQKIDAATHAKLELPDRLGDKYAAIRDIELTQIASLSGNLKDQELKAVQDCPCHKS